MDLSYDTIPHLEGDFVTLYREPITRYWFESPKDPINEICYLDEKMGSFYAIDPTFQVEQCQDTSETWTLEFDGAHSIFGSRVGIVLTTSSKEAFYFPYRLEYDSTNNATEYEALLIGLNLTSI